MQQTRWPLADRTRKFVLVVLLLSAGLAASVRHAGAASLTAVPTVPVAPDLVTEPTINLGGTSFYDGYGRISDGFVYVNFTRWSHLTSISDAKGNEVRSFRNPDIEVFSNVLQPVWVSPLHPFGGGLGILALLPIVDVSSSFTQPGANLRANGLGVGDLSLAPFFQAAPTKLFNQPFVWRTAFTVTAPTGRFDSSYNINQSSGFWSINPYVAATYLPVPGWEVSARLNYIYNFRTDKIPRPPFIPGLSIRNGQAGQAVWLNYAASRKVSDSFSLGVNGYYFQQTTNDRINNIGLAHTRKNQLYLGPGLHWEATKSDIFNFNLYLPVTTHGVASGPQLNLQYAHVF